MPFLYMGMLIKRYVMPWARKKSAILTTAHAHQGKTGITG